jgi:hypothetical protein
VPGPRPGRAPARAWSHGAARARRAARASESGPGPWLPSEAQAPSPSGFTWAAGNRDPQAPSLSSGSESKSDPEPESHRVSSPPGPAAAVTVTVARPVRLVTSEAAWQPEPESCTVTGLLTEPYCCRHHDGPCKPSESHGTFTGGGRKCSASSSSRRAPGPRHRRPGRE